MDGGIAAPKRPGGSSWHCHRHQRLIPLTTVIRRRHSLGRMTEMTIHVTLSIANDRSLSLTLDEDGGIAAPEKILSMILQLQEGWGIFLPFFFIYAAR